LQNGKAHLIQLIIASHLDYLEQSMSVFLERNEIGEDDVAYKYYERLVRARFEATTDFAILLTNFEQADSRAIDIITEQQIHDFFELCSQHYDDSLKTIQRIVAKLTTHDFDISLCKLQTFAMAMRESEFRAESDVLFSRAIELSSNRCRIT